MNKEQDFIVKNNIHNNWQVVHQHLLPEEKEKNFWNPKTFNKLRESIFNRFKNSIDEEKEEDWIKYKKLNNITDANPKRIKFCWETVLHNEKINNKNKIAGASEVELEYYDESNKLVIIKDPVIGISWDYDEPKEGLWIGIPEKLAEKFIAMESFKK